MTFEEWYEQNSELLDDKEVSVAWDLMRFAFLEGQNHGYSKGYDDGFLQGYDKGTDECGGGIDWG